MTQQTDIQPYIDRFKQIPAFETYDQWVGQIMADDYYHEPRFSDEGELLSEDYFDAERFCQAKEESLLYAMDCYYNLKIANEGEIPVCSPEQMSNILKTNHYNQPAVLGSLFCILLMDMSQSHQKWSSLKLQNWELQIGNAFSQLGINHEWLHFYALISKHIWPLPLPDALNTPVAHKYWTKLQQAGFIDELFQFTPKARKGAYRQAIAYHFFLKGFKYVDLQTHFNVKNFRTRPELEKAEERISKHIGKHDEEEVLKAITKCFG